MRACKIFFIAFCLLLLVTGNALAHFGMVIPSQSNVMESREAKVALSLKFWHPFENSGMNLEKPASFQVFFDGKAESLLTGLQEKKERGFVTWQGEYTIKRPGLYAFIMEPRPYFEKEEDCFIVHITKTYVSAFGGGEDWDKPLGLKAEIVPLTDPNALYAGNVFQGRVLQNGKPVPGATVEVEWYPGEGRKGEAAYENMLTHTVKADDSGIFTFAAPRAGWWGFAALLEDEAKITHEGSEKNVEVGAVVWVNFYPLLPAKKQD